MYKTMELLGHYRNGNYDVLIYEDGTKIRHTEEDTFEPAFSESIDCKITNRCYGQCAFCHENSTPNGDHGDILNAEFIDTLRPYTEIAIGGGCPLLHPDLEEFLRKLQDRKVIANMTINQQSFMEALPRIRHFVDERLIYGLGVSYHEYDEECIKEILKFPNAVLHVINGLTNTKMLQNISALSERQLKILILGYKEFRRGKDHYSAQVEGQKRELYRMLPTLMSRFKVVSFDNLAIEQLDVKRLLSAEQWETFYNGDDGSHTFYVDLVNRKFAKNSTSKKTFDLLDSIDEMFAVVKELSV